ncbi:MAG: 16S rRNA (guanine(527)-N(7))-methyltransferase RsmG [Lachnospiraceae bacterium]|jgi:16S rRNA (guanine527-N7)-methyltransferase|nr:16S rRNA (guanine(527)-N(7))-methyltransferase RsmG [Lachnospiraceae bacterium]
MTLNKEYNTKLLLEGLEELNITPTKEQVNRLLRYYELLIEWNEFMNLTAITDYEEVLIKHFVDSATIVKVLSPGKEKIIDVGCGAGFPGLPLKILFPELRMTLLDSLNKRVQFLNEVIKELELTEIEAVHGRAEDFAKNKEYREQYDLCVSRAVANLSTLSEYCLPFVKTGGSFIAYKSEKGSAERDEAENAIKILGGSIVKEVEFVLPTTDNFRIMYQIKKIKETPNKYPRKAGLPAKEPIR